MHFCAFQALSLNFIFSTIRDNHILGKAVGSLILALSHQFQILTESFTLRNECIIMKLNE